nr:substrate-binding domain-containing protein [Nonomuraea sp. FMUSA5-5]
MAFDRKPYGGKGKVVEIQGILGTNVAQDRSKGFQQQIATHKDIRVVATQAADFDRAKALNVMTNVLQANPDIDGVYAANDEMAMGVLAALKARNLVGKVKVVGNDGIADALAAVAAGQMYATNAESPFALGQKVISLAGDVLGGKQVQPDETLRGELVTKDNVKEYADHLTSLGDKSGVPDSLK